MTRFKILSGLFGVFLLLFLAGRIFLGNLGASTVSTRSDEVVYVRVAQTVAKTGDFFPLRHGGVPFYEKPPLKFILSAIVLKVFGESNVTFRILDGALGVCAIVLAMILTFLLSGSAASAIVVGLLLLGVPEWTISPHSFRRAVLDGLLTVLTLCASLFAWRAQECLLRGEKPWIESWLFGAMCALGAMTKSVGGLVPVGVAGLLIMAGFRKIPRAAWISLVPGLVLGPLCLLLYCFCLWIYAPRAFHTFIGVEVVQRVYNGFTGHNIGDPFFYLRYIFVRGGIVPPILLAMGLIGTAWKYRSEPALRFCAAWCGLPLALFSCASAKVPWYLNPYAPFFTILAVLGTTTLLSHFARGEKGWFVLVPFFVLVFSPYWSGLARHLAFVDGDTRRIPFDLLTEELKTSNAHVIILDDCISGRANPVKGRFNVEGIYREMLRDRLTVQTHIPQEVPMPGVVILSSEESQKLLPAPWKSVHRLEPFPPRKESVLVTRY